MKKRHYVYTLMALFHADVTLKDMKILQTIVISIVLFAAFYWISNTLLLKFPDVVFWVKGLFNR